MSGVIGVDVQLLFKLSRGTSQYMTSYPTESYFNLNETWLGICINTLNFRDAKYSSVYFFTPSKKFRKPQKISNSSLDRRKKDKNILVEGDKVNKGTISSFFPLEKTRAQMANDNFRKPGKTFLI